MRTEYFLYREKICCAFITESNLVGVYWPESDAVSDAIMFTSRATCAYWWGQMSLELQANGSTIREDCPLPNNLSTLHERCCNHDIQKKIIARRLSAAEKQKLVNLLHSAGESFEQQLQKLIQAT